MEPLTEAQIRSSFVNAPADVGQRVPLPGLHEVIWDEREYLGWRDAVSPRRAYLTVWKGGAPVSFVLRAAEAPDGRRIGGLCSLCHTAHPGSSVALFSARRAGERGDNGDSVGVYICADLGCSQAVRIAPAPQAMQIAPDEVVQRRIAQLEERVDAFTSTVLAA